MKRIQNKYENISNFLYLLSETSWFFKRSFVNGCAGKSKDFLCLFLETDASNLRLGWISWIYSLCCNCWANEDTNTFSTSKWPSEPYFCERYKYQCSYFNWLQSCDLKRKLIIFSPVANLMHQSLGSWKKDLSTWKTVYSVLQGKKS